MSTQDPVFLINHSVKYRAAGPWLMLIPFGIFLLIHFSGYLADSSALGFLIFAEIVLWAIWGYRQRYFPFLMLIFLLAGTAVPTLEFWQTIRWPVLGIGALVGVITYMREPVHQLDKFHLMAFFSVTAAFVSSFSSSYPTDSRFKVLSLLLLFLYGASGMRVAVQGKEESFFLGLLKIAEALTYFCGFCYFALGYKFFGNPNSLGATMGVVVVPTLLWGVLTSKSASGHTRYLIALLLSVLLLLTSYARAGMLAACVSSVLMCVGLRRYRVLVLLAAVSVAIAVTMEYEGATVSNHPQSLSSTFIYKGTPEKGILASRRTPWQQTMASVREHSWFGTGFGTSATGTDESESFNSFKSTARNTREHGNSYLAILEWVGVLGVAPFFALLLLIMWELVKALLRVRALPDAAASPLVPAAGIVIAGLVHAGFEDWLFATGYYLCIFFWGITFVLVDLVSLRNQSSPFQTTNAPSLVNAIPAIRA
jgi:O-antigen ligase